MKGTPFFTGESIRRTGAVEDRVNLWPMLYYREPDLSVLWPIGEYTGDSLALRPLFSIENLDQPQRVYNVLWPLGRFDSARSTNRFFPFFWGDDHRVVFPLYWHYGRPLADNGIGSDSLWPLWCYFHDHQQYSLHLLWPVFNIKAYDDEQGWRLWPLYGSYEKPKQEAGHRYALWPLAWQTWGKTEHTWTLLPLFHDAHDSDTHTFITLLGGWQRNRATETTDWCALPILGWGSSTPDTSRTTALLGLYGDSHDNAATSSRLLPLYYYKKTPEQSLFLSPLYLSSSTTGAESWRLLVPLALHRRSPHGTSLYTPLYAQGSDTERQSRWSCLLPLYYEDSHSSGSTFITPLGGWWTDAERKSWAIYPLLSGGRRRTDGGDLWIGGPLFHAAWNPAGTSHWLLPLYAYNADHDSFLSLFYNAWDNADGGVTRLIPPLLSAYSARPNRWDLWALAGLGHASGGSEGGSSHLLPIYYANPRHNLLLTPLYAAWNADPGRTHAIPLLLSAWYADDECHEIIGALGLFRARWGDTDTSDEGHLLPLYYYDHQTLLTPLFGHWQNGGTRMRYWLTPLLGTRSGQTHGSWLAPLYSYTADPVRQDAEGWYLIFGEFNRSPHTSYTYFPLLFEHQRWKSPNDEPLAPGRREGWSFDALLLAKFASYRYLETRTPTLAVIQSTNEVPSAIHEPMSHSESRLFPLWAYDADHSATSNWQRANGNLLFCLYDYRREHGLVPPQSAPHDYTRRRVLFRLVHHERLNGATSLDVFPGITYDRDPAAGKRSFTLFWRLFRYSRAPDKRALDLLFIPVWRKRIEPPLAPETARENAH